MTDSIFNVDTAALLTQEFFRLPLRRRGRRVHPVDQDAALVTIFTEGYRDAKQDQTT
jgi:hypothetical protein